MQPETVESELGPVGEDMFAHRLQPRRAFRALRALRNNPHDTAQVFEVIEAFSGRAPLRVLARFRREPQGQRLLAERPQLLRTLSDRAALERLEEGSLGRSYLEFLDREGITAEGLVQASEDGSRSVGRYGRDLEFVRQRMRDSHDLWHVVTGYEGDILGELALLAFNVAQLGNPGLATIVLTGLTQTRTLGDASIVGRAFYDGLRASWLPSQPWESLLPLPLIEVRDLLQIRRTPTYGQLRFDREAGVGVRLEGNGPAIYSA